MQHGFLLWGLFSIFMVDEEEKSLFSPTTAEANFHQKTASNVIVEGSSLFLVAIILLTLMTWEKL